VDQDDYGYRLGSSTRPVTSGSPSAQTWFDRGLIWAYGFHHEESVACFQRALAEDPDCAMAWWGIAYSLGPNYNKPWEFYDGEDLRTTVHRTHEAVQRALALADRCTEVERALIEALTARYPQAEVSDAAAGSVWNLAYARAMQAVHERFGDDLDVAALYSDALMNLTPWQLWDPRTEQPALGARTLDAKAVLDRALSTDSGRNHPGLLHMYIHLMEMSPTPEVAVVVADRLRGLVPDAGHLEHMPTHLDVLIGDYRRAISSNLSAIAADETYLAQAGPMNFYTLYRSHNRHFVIYGAMFLGQSRVALQAVEELEVSIPEALLRTPSPPMADWLEGFLAMRVHVSIRFGRWQDLIELPLPDDPELYCTTTAMAHYAKGVAYAATGRIAPAEQQRTLFRAAVERVPESRMLFNNTCRDILAIASAMLDGELEYRQGNHDEAFRHLERSIALDDALPYDEPWGWMQPTRHAYGALLLEQGRVEEAEVVYRADLGLDDTLPRPVQHPNNVWSLHGLHECLTRLGKAGEAAIIGRQLALATALADVPIESSCFCRGSSPSPAPDGCCHP